MRINMVCMAFEAPRVLDLIEPWVTPLLSTINHTRKTGESCSKPQLFVMSNLLETPKFQYQARQIIGVRHQPSCCPPRSRTTKSPGRATSGARRRCSSCRSRRSSTWQVPPRRCFSARTQERAADAGGKTMKARGLEALAKLNAEWSNAAEPGATLRPIESWELQSDEPAWKQRTFIWRPSGAAWTAIGFCPLQTGTQSLGRGLGL